MIGSEPDWQRLRIERAVPAYGTDYDDRDNPHDASLERRAVSWTKGCYLGQEVVCMQDMRGKLKRRIVTLAFDSRDPPAPGAIPRRVRCPTVRSRARVGVRQDVQPMHLVEDRVGAEVRIVLGSPVQRSLQVPD